jgi:hypothetical protein
MEIVYRYCSNANSLTLGNTLLGSATRYTTHLSSTVLTFVLVYGNLVDLEKTGGRWHVPGSLTVRSKPYLKQTLQKMNTFLDSCTDCKLLLLVPILRHVVTTRNMSRIGPTATLPRKFQGSWREWRSC